MSTTADQSLCWTRSNLSALDVRMRVSRLCSLLVLALIVAVSARAQTRDLEHLLAGKTVPLSIQLKELTSDWRKFSIQTHVNVSDNISVNVNGESHATSQNNLNGALGSSRDYVSKGETASANGRVYLIAYHLPGSALDVTGLLQALVTKSPPAAAKLVPETTLALSLLDVATLGSIDDIKAFDWKAEIAESERSARVLGELLKAQSSGTSTNAPAKGEAEKE